MAKVSSEYWSYDDPRWANDPAYGNPETMKYVGPWEQVLQATGFRGKVYEPMIEMQPDPNGGFMPLEVGQQYTPQAKAAIDSLRASGYDLRWKHPDKRTFNTYWGFVTPDGVQDIKIEGSDIGDMIKPLIKTWGAGLGLAGLGAGINSLLGGAGAGSGAGAVNALAGGGIGGTSGAAFADIAGGLLPEFGTSAAYSAGLQGLPAVGGALSAADLATLPSDVLGQAGSLSPTNLAELDVFTTPPSSMTPLPNGSPSVTPLTELPPSLGPVTPPTFEFGTLVDPAALGIAEGMAPGVLAPVTAAELASVNALLGGAGGVLGAGAGATGGVAGGGGVAAPTATATTAPAVADVAATGATGAATGGGAAVPTAATGGAIGAATGGAGIMEGMVPGGLTGSGIPATLGEASAAGAVAAGAGASGGSLLDKAVKLVTSPVGQAVVGGVGSAIGGVLEANAAEKAAETQSQAAANALALQREMFEYQKGLLEPYRTAGTKALERLSGAMNLGGPGSQQQMLEMDPGYGFRLGEGLKALERMQASRGNFLSGGALKAGQRFAQDTASQEYGNAYNRLANIAGLGQTAGTQMGNAASGFGTSAGNIMGQEANALAAGRLGRTSAYTGALGGALNSFQNYLNRQQEERLVRDIFGRTTVGG
jgi:hypothetical protein